MRSCRCGAARAGPAWGSQSFVRRGGTVDPGCRPATATSVQDRDDPAGKTADGNHCRLAADAGRMSAGVEQPSGLVAHHVGHKGSSASCRTVGATRHGGRGMTGLLVIVAAIDTGFLWLVGVPLPLLWGLLAFITNYIPNVGIIVGVVPPALLALLEGGTWASRRLVGVRSMRQAVAPTDPIMRRCYRLDSALRARHQCQASVTMIAPASEPMIPLGRKAKSSPEIRLMMSPPTKEPTIPAASASPQSTPVADLPTMSCAPAPMSIPNKMQPSRSMPRPYSVSARARHRLASRLDRKLPGCRRMLLLGDEFTVRVSPGRGLGEKHRTIRWRASPAPDYSRADVLACRHPARVTTTDPDAGVIVDLMGNPDETVDLLAERV